MAKDKTYDKIDRPYSNHLLRTEKPVEMNDVFDVNQREGSRTIKEGTALNDIWIDTWIKSRTYQPKKQGFFLDAKRGYIEGTHFAVGTGIDFHGNDGYFYDYSVGGKTIETFSIHTPGSGYQNGNILEVQQGGADGGHIIVTSVNPSGGIVAASTYFPTSSDNPGAGYSVENGVNVIGGSGTGAKINILSVTGRWISGDTTSIRFQRKYFPDQEVIIQKRVGNESVSQDKSDNVFEIFYPNAPQVDSRNWIFLGLSGESRPLNFQHTDIVSVYGNQGMQFSTRSIYGIDGDLFPAGAPEFQIYTKGFYAPGLDDLDFLDDGISRISIANAGWLEGNKPFDPTMLSDFTKWKGGGIIIGSHLYSGSGYVGTGLSFLVDYGTTWFGNDYYAPLADNYVTIGALNSPTGIEEGKGLNYFYKEVCTYKLSIGDGPSLEYKNATGGAITGVSINYSGVQYEVGDIISVNEGTGAKIEVTSVGAVNGDITGFTLLSGGSGYVTKNDVETRGGSGTDATFDIVAEVITENGYFDFSEEGSVHTYKDFYANKNIEADYENTGDGVFAVGGDLGVSSHTVTLAALTPGGTEGELVIKGGIIISVVDPT